MKKPVGVQAFMLQSMAIQLKAEQKKNGVITEEDEEGGE